MNFLKDEKFKEIFPNNLECYKKLLGWQIFYDTRQCPGCNRNMKKIEENQVFRCMGSKCSKRELTIRKNTFFYNCKMSFLLVMQLARLWLMGVSQKAILIGYSYSEKTISKYFNYFRQLVSAALTEENTQIGGPNVIVEIDETKLGKRKYNRGHRVEGVWVLCGVERTVERKVFCVAVEKRDALTLENIIAEHVFPGSIVHTDLWRGYSNLEAGLGLLHRTVNHSQCFVDPITGVHTNTIEGTNNGLKIQIKPRNRVAKNMEYHLGEFVWRRLNTGRLAEAFIDALKNIHYE